MVDSSRRRLAPVCQPRRRCGIKGFSRGAGAYAEAKHADKFRTFFAFFGLRGTLSRGKSFSFCKLNK